MFDETEGSPCAVCLWLVQHEPPPPLGLAASAAMVVSSVSGNVLEYYDFSLYAYFTSEISKQFLPGNDPVIKLIEVTTHTRHPRLLVHHDKPGPAD